MLHHRKGIHKFCIQTESSFLFTDEISYLSKIVFALASFFLIIDITQNVGVSDHVCRVRYVKKGNHRRRDVECKLRTKVNEG